MNRVKVDVFSHIIMGMETGILIHSQSIFQKTIYDFSLKTFCTIHWLLENFYKQLLSRVSNPGWDWPGPDPTFK